MLVVSWTGGEMSFLFAECRRGPGRGRWSAVQGFGALGLLLVSGVRPKVVGRSRKVQQEMRGCDRYDGEHDGLLL